jgi:hypothetical protein
LEGDDDGYGDEAWTSSKESEEMEIEFLKVSQILLSGWRLGTLSAVGKSIHHAFYPK